MPKTRVIDPNDFTGGEQELAVAIRELQERNGLAGPRREEPADESSSSSKKAGSKKTTR